jgi:ribonuclease III
MHPLFQFTNEQLRQQALTHSSYIKDNPQAGSDNERLEFLGDAILNFISGAYLYRNHPDMAEGEMTRRRSALVDEKQLARFAIALGLDTKLRLGRGVIHVGGYQNTNILSSALEAVIGAYYLDRQGDIEALRPLVEELFASVPEEVLAARSQLDPKNQLQELIQARGMTSPPTYVSERTGGPDHAPEFLTRVLIGGQLWGEGRGTSKRNAERQAAIDALAQQTRSAP